MRLTHDLAAAAGTLFSRIIVIPFTPYTSATEHLAIGTMSAGLILIARAGLRAWRLRGEG